jgi:hypothetical protein
MQKFRICAGAVKVWSAKLLMGISWRSGVLALPAYRGMAAAAQSRRHWANGERLRSAPPVRTS